MEDEFDAWLGRARYERRLGAPPGRRNGYRPRRLQTAERELEIEIPQVREAAEPFVSKLFPRGTKLLRTEPLKAMVVDAFVRGLSLRDVESLCDQAGLGKLWKSTAARISSELRERFTGLLHARGRVHAALMWGNPSPETMFNREEVVSRIARVLCLAAATCLLAAAPAYGKAHHVHEGESIQAALDAASSGDTVIVHRGTYRESLLIDKDGIRLRGKHALLLPPAAPSDTICNQFEPITGICVAGDFNPATNEVFNYVTGVKVTGLTVQSFSGVGIFAVATERLRVSHDKLLDNGGYGVFALISKRPRYLHDLARGNGAPGLYVGDSPEANAVIRHNRSIDNNGEGILLRNAIGGRVSHNKLVGNCAGLFALADAPGPAGKFKIDHNRATANNRACPGEPDEGEPPISGVGVGLIGAFDTRVSHNRVFGNQASGDSFVKGGIVAVKGPGGTAPENDLIDHNKAFDNLPDDLVWDESGSVRFKKNKCGTSDPDGLCTGGGRGHGKHAAKHGHG